MATFVYAPAIRVHVESDKLGIIDISEDITQWELTRRSNTVSSFNFMLQNTQRKYDGVFRPSDRISVELKRITWMRVFTGTLNNVPIFSAWPRALPMSASCSLKKLQFWPWDPTTTAAVNLTQRYINAVNASNAAGDGGLSTLIRDALHDVAEWDTQAIHIGAVPNDWFKWAQQTEKDIDAAASMASVLGASTIIGGSSLFGNLKLPTGVYGAYGLSNEQLANAAIIFQVAVTQAGLSTVADQDRAAHFAISVAGNETALTNLPGGDRDSVGLFQQRAPWGSYSDRHDPARATLMFLKGGHGGQKGLLDQNNWRTGFPFDVAMNTQVAAGYPYWNEWWSTGGALVTKFREKMDSNLRSSDASGNSGLSDPIVNGQGGGRAMGDTLAKVAYDLIQSRQSDPILYSIPQRDDPRTSHPKYLDCSSFVSWVYYHATGDVWAGTYTGNQYPLCSIKVPMNIAQHIRGALGFAIGPNGPHHVGMSLGNGETAAAHDHFPSDPTRDVSIVSFFHDDYTTGALIDGIDYTHAATTEDARAWLQNALKKPCEISSAQDIPNISNPSLSGAGASGTSPSNADPFGQLISALVSAPRVNGNIFGGPRLLMNNQPFLPWVTNLTNSSMRSFCSAPNGDFIAWFPDYFNVWETAAVMKVRPIEVKDFTVEWSDQQIVTHEFVIGSIQPLLDNGSGSIVDGGPQSYTQLYAMLGTHGLATMDFPQIFESIYGKKNNLTKDFVNKYLQRFGARPNLEAMPNIIHGPQEFYMALWMFMKHWSEQFNATIPLTFMPELWPGMIVQLDDPVFGGGFQAYVTEVTHRGSYGSNGGFTTDAKIIAPAPIDKDQRDSMFGMLDL